MADLVNTVVTAHLHPLTGVVAVAVELANKDKMDLHQKEEWAVMV